MKVIDARVRLRTEVLMEAWTTKLNPVFKDYITLYKMKPRISVIPVQEMLDMGLECGVEKMVVCGGNRVENDHILKIAREYERIIPVGGTNLKNGVHKAMEEIQRCKEGRVENALERALKGKKILDEKGPYRCAEAIMALL